MFRTMATSERKISLFMHLAYVPTLFILEEKMLLSMSLCFSINSVISSF